MMNANDPAYEEWESRLEGPGDEGDDDLAEDEGFDGEESGVFDVLD